MSLSSRLSCGISTGISVSFIDSLFLISIFLPFFHSFDLSFSLQLSLLASSVFLSFIVLSFFFLSSFFQAICTYFFRYFCQSASVCLSSSLYFCSISVSFFVLDFSLFLFFVFVSLSLSRSSSLSLTHAVASKFLYDVRDGHVTRRTHAWYAVRPFGGAGHLRVNGSADGASVTTDPDDLTEEFCTSLLSAPVSPSAIDDFHAPRVINASPQWLLQKQIWVMPSVRCSELGGRQTSEKSDGDPRRCTHLPDTWPTPRGTCECAEGESGKGKEGQAESAGARSVSNSENLCQTCSVPTLICWTR